MEALANDPKWNTWTDFLSKTFDTCFSAAESKSEDFKVSFALHPAFEGEKICHPISGAVMSCVDAAFFVNCPGTLWKGDGECDAIKNFARICKEMPPIKV